MDKDRFNALLADLDQITDADIKSLNQLRKKYPYFQNQYVMIARALKKREHPKADAFVRKAALFVGDQALLKGIINGTHDFQPTSDSKVEAEAVKAAAAEAKRKAEEVSAQKAAEEEAQRKTEEEAKRKAAEEEARRKAEEAAAQKAAEEAKIKEAAAKKAAEEEARKKATEAAEAKKAAEAKRQAEEAERKAKEAAAKKKAVEDKAAEEAKKEAEEQAKPTASKPAAESNDQMLSELEKDLKEIKEKKRLLAKMLEQSEAKSKSPQPSAEKKSPGRSKKSQSELIEKFIRNEPQMDKQKLVSDENSPAQVDLASENIKESEEFYTETLAKLMLKQKKYKKAVKIYEKLGLKFPEKSAYFASQIEKVNNRSNV